MSKAAKQKAYEEAERRLERYIGSHNLRHTMERYTILRFACELNSPFTAEQIINLATEKNISKGTVYNTLALLVSARILWCLGRKGLKTEYEMATNGEKIRMQIQCIRCGRVSTVKDTAIEDIVRSKRFNNFNYSHYSMYIYGTCKVCKSLLIKENK